MKKFNLVLAGSLLLGGSVAFADTLNSGSSAATVSAFNPTGAFWNNTSSDAVGLSGSNAANVGNFLGATGGFAPGNGPYSPSCSTCGVNYMANGGQMYVGTGGTPETGLNFVKQAGGMQIALLYANSGANGFTEFGIYDASSQANAVNNHLILQSGLSTNLNNDIGNVYTSGMQFTGATNDGLYSLSNGSPYATWGIYVRTCEDGTVALSACYTNGQSDIVTFYMGIASQESPTYNNDAAHQHFALFQSGSDMNTYYAGVEDYAFNAAHPAGNGVEGYGDFNDLIFGIVTSDPPPGNPTNNSVLPEPATISIVGLGLLGIGVLGRRKLKK